MNVSTLRIKRALLLPAAALAVIVGTSGCSLMFDGPDDPDPTSSQSQEKSDQNEPDQGDSTDADESDDQSDQDESDQAESDPDESTGTDESDDQSGSPSDTEGSDPYDSDDSDTGQSDGSGQTSHGESGDPVHKSYVSYLREHGVSQVSSVSRTDPGSPAVTVNSPAGWHHANSRGPAGSYLTIVNDSPSVGSFKPNAIGYMFKVPSSTDYTSVTAASRSQLESLPGFDRKSTSYNRSTGTGRTGSRDCTTTTRSAASAS